jgi:hypothetical protein
MMSEWYEVTKNLTEVRGKEREEYVAMNNTRMRSVSGASSVDSQEEVQDEEDEQRYSAQARDHGPVEETEEEKQRPKRPQGVRDIMIIRVIDNHNRDSVSSDLSDAAVASLGVFPAAAAIHQDGQVERDEGFREGFGNVNNHHMDQSYVILPNEQRRDSWSPIEHVIHPISYFFHNIIRLTTF